MTTINNYKELVAERTRLEGELRNQKLVLKADLDEVKLKLEPVTEAISMLGIVEGKHGRKSSLLRTGLSMGIDFLVRDNLLYKAGWATKIVLPAVIKGISKLFLNKVTSNNMKSSGDYGSTPKKREAELVD